MGLGVGLGCLINRFCCVRSVERSWVGVVGVRGVELVLGVCRGGRDHDLPARGGLPEQVVLGRLVVVGCEVVE
jgi:hypothetical protein